MYRKQKKCLNSRSGHDRCSIEKAVLKNFSTITGKHLSLFFNRAAGLKASNFIKSDSNKDTCSPVNIAKFLRTPTRKEIFKQLLLQFLLLAVNISSQGLVSALNTIVPLQGPLQVLFRVLSRRFLSYSKKKERKENQPK